MLRVTEEVLAWLASFACLIYILRSIKQVLLPAGGLWRSPFVMFTAGALFAIIATAVASACCVMILTERCRPKSDSHQGAIRGGNAPVRRPWLLRRAKGHKGEGGAVNLVTAHPSAVRQGSYTGPVWLVPATLWTRGQLASQWPPLTQGPAAIARKFHATLVRSRTQYAAALLLVPELVARGGGSTGGSQQALLTDIDHGNYPVLSLDDVTVDLMRDILGTRSPWTKRCPLQLSHPSRPLLMGETTVYMFAESGSAKEQWYAALMSAVAPQGLLATTQHMYEDYCRYMASLQIVQPPPLPPPSPPPAMLQPWRFRTRNMQHGRQHRHKEQRQQQEEEQRHPHHQEQLQQQQRSDATSAPTASGAPAATTAVKGSQPHAPTGKERDEKKVNQQRQHQQGQHPLQATGGPSKPSAQLDPVATAPQRGGRNPFGFILSRFGRSACRRSDNPVATPAVAVVATTPEAPFSNLPSHVGSQTSIHPSEAAQQPLQQGLLGRMSEQQQGQQEVLQGRLEGNLTVDPGQLTGMEHDGAGCQGWEQAFSRPTGTTDSNASTSACQPLPRLPSSPQQLPLPSQQQNKMDHQEQGEVTPLEALDVSVAPDFSASSARRAVSDIFTASRPFSQSCQVTPGDAMKVPSASAAASTPVKQGRDFAVPDGPTAGGIALLRAQPTLSEAAGRHDEAASSTRTVAARKGIAAATAGDMSLSVHSRASHAYASTSAGMGAVTAGGLVHIPRSGHTEPSFNSWSQLQVAGIGMATGLVADVVADADSPMVVPAEHPRAVTPSAAPSSSSANTAAVTASAPVLVPSAPDAGVLAAGVPGITSRTESAALQAATAEAARGESAGVEAVAMAASDVLEKQLQTAAAPSQGKQQRTPLGTWGCAQDNLEPLVSSRLALKAPCSGLETSGSSPCDRSPTASGSSTMALQSSHILAVAAAAVPSRTGVSMSLPLLEQQPRNSGSMPDLLEVARWAVEKQDLGGEVSEDSPFSMKAAAGESTAKTALSWRSLDHCLGEGSSIPKGHGPMGFKQGAQQPILRDEARHAISLRVPSPTETLAPETNTAGALLSGRSCNGAGSVSQRVVAKGGMPKNPSKHDLKRMQREEQERLKQEHQRAKAAARATEGARRAEERAARERARSEAHYRRLEDEARARQAKERARALKQKLTSAKSVQDLATAAATSATSEPSLAGMHRRTYVQRRNSTDGGRWFVSYPSGP
ncbi:hypothetical protein VaNZ11_010927 [Volvox africanus]|uniref:PH domain-containing protein n=1 Tax=Volvox africanus TaxID=51714 RepID=A0ABQ5SAE6_9CHLO|nr:hypothetical protein VaNZ11_010927 [Volvox africanus]